MEIMVEVDVLDKGKKIFSITLEGHTFAEVEAAFAKLSIAAKGEGWKLD